MQPTGNLLIVPSGKWYTCWNKRLFAHVHSSIHPSIHPYVGPLVFEPHIIPISLTVSVTPESVQGVLESAGIAVLSCSPPESLRRSLDQFSLATAVLRRGVDREKPSD